jgi:hypothetical protein
MQKILASILLFLVVLSGYTQFRPAMPPRPLNPAPMRPPIVSGGGMMGGGVNGFGGNSNVGGMGGMSGGMMG